jgi:hypothetical protein
VVFYHSIKCLPNLTDAKKEDLQAPGRLQDNAIECLSLSNFEPPIGT